MKLLKCITTFLLTGTLISAIAVTTKTLATENSKDSLKPSPKDAIALMKSICGADNVNSQADGDSCEKCPSYVNDAGSGGTLTSVVYGSFTKAGTREALVDLEGCQAHAGHWGGSVLLRSTSKGWLVVRYEKGLRSERCVKFKNPIGRMFLVCEGSYTQRGYTHTWLDAIEFGAAKTTESQLINVVSNVGSCRPPYSEVQILDFGAQDINNDGLNNLVVKVSEAREAKDTSRSNDEMCEAHLPLPSFHQLTFLFDGQSFRPTPETANLKKLLEA